MVHFRPESTQHCPRADPRKIRALSCCFFRFLHFLTNRRRIINTHCSRIVASDSGLAAIVVADALLAEGGRAPKIASTKNVNEKLCVFGRQSRLADCAILFSAARAQKAHNNGGRREHTQQAFQRTLTLRKLSYNDYTHDPNKSLCKVCFSTENARHKHNKCFESTMLLIDTPTVVFLSL